VLFELVSRRRPFEGETVSETLAAVLMKDADWNALPSAVPPKVRRLLQRCLTRDPRNRLQDIGEARIALDAVLAGDSGLPDAGSNGAVSMAKQRAWSWLGAGALVGLAAGWIVFSLVGSPKTATATDGIMRVTVQAFPGLEKTANLAPARDDGYVVYEGHKGGVATLYLHDFESGEVRPIAGTEGGMGPFLSPDGLWLGFHRGRELLKIRLSGGDPVKLCPAPTNVPGAIWTEGGTIVFAPGWLQGLWRVPADGGVPVPLTTVEADAGEKAHWWPRPLPDGRHALFTIWTSGAGLIDSDVAVLDLESGEHRTLFRGADAWFLPPGHIIYYRAGSYHAVGFDADRLEVVGDPVPVLEDATDPMPQGTEELGLAISTRGTLYYLTRQINPPARLAIVTPGAAPEMLAFPARALTSFAVSPNGRTVAASSLESGVVRLHLLDMQSGTDERLDLAGSNWKPTWKPDGSGFAFLSLRKGHFDIYFRDVATDGAEQPTRVTPTDEFPHGWSPDGTTLFFVETQSDGTQPLKVLPMNGTNVEATVLQNLSTKAVALSPDGRWLAYDAERDGRSDVYVRPYKGPGVEVRVSPARGRQPAWSPDGTELYYVRENSIVANRVAFSQDRFQPGPAEVVFQSSLVAPNNVSEGPLAVLGPRRFLVALLENELEPPSMNVVLNWSREVAKRLPAR